jgi:hypothetical protein
MRPATHCFLVCRPPQREPSRLIRRRKFDDLGARLHSRLRIREHQREAARLAEVTLQSVAERRVRLHIDDLHLLERCAQMSMNVAERFEHFLRFWRVLSENQCVIRIMHVWKSRVGSDHSPSESDTPLSKSLQPA